MGMAEEMKSLAQEMVASYDTRILAVAMMIEATHQMIEAFKSERVKMSEQLKEKLATGESLRRKDFDAMMQGILSRQEEREEEVRRLLKGFVEEHQKMASELKGLLADAESKIEDFRAVMRELQTRQMERSLEVRTALEGFQREHEEMARELRTLLAKGESLKIGALKATLNKIRTRQEEKELRVES